MKYAKNIYDEKISASVASRYQCYRCLDCDAPVVLRSGSVQQPHFGHRQNTARMDCRYYHRGYDNDYSPPPANSNKNNSYWQSGIYCSGDIDSKFELFLRLPQSSQFPKWPGEIIVQGKWGVKTFHWEELQSPQYVQISLHKPFQKDVRFLGEVDPFYLENVRSVPDLDPDFNCFKFSETYGRRLNLGDSLYWSEKYWVLASSQVPSPPEDLKVLAKEHSRQWTMYLVELPPYSDVSVEKIGGIKAWLRHEIELQPPTVEILSPLPLRISKDGAYVVSPKAESAIIYSKSEERLLAFAQHGCEVDLSYNEELSLYYIQLVNPETAVFNGGELIGVFKKEVVSLFRPEGIKVTVGECNFELPCNHLVSSDFKKGRNIQIELPHEKLGTIIKLNSHKLEVAKDSKLLSSNLAEFSFLDCENYGAVELFNEDETSKYETIFNQHSGLVKLLLNLAISPHDNALGFPCEVPSDAPILLKKLVGLRWGSNHICYLMQLQKLMGGRFL